ncbi:unnamed protein product [Effrenium voratum]|nr:unnamed protein product [Effrenium voratum]
MLAMLGLLVAGLGGALGRDAPAALEASYKERIQGLLNASAEAAAQHLSKRLALKSELFGGYEFEYGEQVRWLHGCLDIVVDRDSVENCVLRQLQALTALCGVPLSKDSKTIVEKHVKHLLKAKSYPSLGMRLQQISGASVFVFQKQPGSSDVDASPAIQASVLMAAARCGEALGKKNYLDDAESWFLGLQKIYPESLWNESFISYHRSAIMWESLAVTALHVGEQSSFHEDLEEYLHRFEAFLRRAWEGNAEYWSFASARALAIRWPSKAAKKQRLLLKRWATEHVDRFLGRSESFRLQKGPEVGISQGILARIGGARYTCGPLQGLASLAAMLMDAELVQVVLQLLEKDVNRYQLSQLNPGPLGEAFFRETLGAFFRDDDQLQLEKRSSMRVDDTAMCLLAISHMLEALTAIKGVVVNTERIDKQEEL